MLSSMKNLLAVKSMTWFTDEQIEEEASAGKITDELAMVGEDKSALLMLDRELGARAYPPGSPFDPTSASAE